MEAAEYITEVKKQAVQIGKRKLVFLSATPQNKKSLQKNKNSAPFLFIEGHNLRPRKDDDVIKIAYDIQELADNTGCEVYGIVPFSNGSYDIHLSDSYPQNISVTRLHHERAADILAAIKKLQKEHKIPALPFDVIGYSDGGVLSAVMAYQDPHAFRSVTIVNSPGFDGSAPKEMYLHASVEGTHVGRSFIKRLLNRKEDRRRLSFTGEKTQLSAWEGISRQFLEKQAIAYTNIYNIIPQVLEKNKKVVVQLINTDEDAMSKPTRVKSVVEEVLTLEMQKRVIFTTTGWEIHTMGYFVTIRKQKLQDLGRWVMDLRK